MILNELSNKEFSLYVTLVAISARKNGGSCLTLPNNKQVEALATLLKTKKQHVLDAIDTLACFNLLDIVEKRNDQKKVYVADNTIIYEDYFETLEQMSAMVAN